MSHKRFREIHFVGIGGIGMSGIAEVLLNLGYKVTGSDLLKTEITKRLESLGAKVFEGHRMSHVKQPDAVVISSAVSQTNPEVVKAKKLKIPVIPRAEMLAELMRMKRGIAIAGTHGKTTTTSMIGTMLAACGVDPTVVIGGRLNRWGTNAKLGQGELLVAEADESDGSFNLLSPTIAVVTNIDDDHLDYYGNLENIKKAFATFLNKLPFYGAGIVCGDDKNVLLVLKDVKKRILTYGISNQCDYQAKNIHFKDITSNFDVYFKHQKLGNIQLQVPGLHNVKNALSAVVVGRELDLPFQKIRKGLVSYTGVQRRFQIRGEVSHVTVLDDYGHHPTEIEATLAACKKVWPKRRLVVVFQPHRYTRTRDLLKKFATAFHDADLILITEIYPAGEKPISGVKAEKLVPLIKKHKREVYFTPRREHVAFELEKMIKSGDVVLTLGAGDVWKVGEELLELMKRAAVRK